MKSEQDETMKTRIQYLCEDCERPITVRTPGVVLRGSIAAIVPGPLPVKDGEMALHTTCLVVAIGKAMQQPPAPTEIPK
jgi:hypothetical protein